MLKKIIKDNYYRLTGPFKAKKFKFTDFTIISNNCFGGVVYRNHHLPYLTPTAGLFIMPSDYIKFIYNLKHYLSIVPKEIPIDKSNFTEYLRKIDYNGTIGKIDDVEIMFLHYKDFNEAKEKWLRRIKKINYNKIIFKFNDQNECTVNELKKFQEFNAKNKILFTAKKYNGIDSYVLSQYEKYGYVLDDVKLKNLKNVFNVYEYVNNMILVNERSDKND